MNADPRSTPTQGRELPGLHPSPDSKLPASASAAHRNAALDFLKGFLVLLMVVYHCFNYFNYKVSVLRYLHFLPPSFIFITGFLITNIYLTKYDIADSQMHRRLFVRGLKLLGIFVGLNLLVHSVFSVNYNKRELGLDFFLNHLDSIFLIGGQRAAVFEVLIPISYLLLLSALLFKGCRLNRYFLHAMAGATLVLCLVLAYDGSLTFYLELLSMGLLGMMVGFVPLGRIDRIASHLPLLALASVAYVTVITFRYPTYYLNMVGVVLTLLLLYSIGLKAGPKGLVQERIILLGNYSLLAYIVQIGILQTLFRVLRHFGVVEGLLAIALIATLILTVASIEAVNAVRTRSLAFNRIYRAVFA